MTDKIFSELYISLQGEGIKVGRPSIIARFPKCNLACGWCDTQNNQPAKFSLYDFGELVNGYPTYDIIITGGEPMLYQHEIMSMISKTRDEGYDSNITIETNGTIFPSDYLLGFTKENNVLWSVSPKICSSGEVFNLDTITKFSKLENSTKTFKSQFDIQFKFVIDNDCDLDEALLILSAINKPKIPILLQPVLREDDTLEIYSKRGQWLGNKILELSKETGHKNIRLGVQLHKILWGFEKKQI